VFVTAVVREIEGAGRESTHEGADARETGAGKNFSPGAGEGRVIVTRGEGEDAVKIPWAHLDIAGPAHNTGSAFGFTGAGPTGISLRALLRVAEDFSRP